MNDNQSRLAYWVNKVTAIYKSRIAEAKAQDQLYFELIEEKAKEDLLVSYGLSKQYQRLKSLHVKINEQRQELIELSAVIHEQLTGEMIPPSIVTLQSIEDILATSATKHEAKYLEHSELGRLVLTLETNRDKTLNQLHLAETADEMRAILGDHLL